MKFNRFAIPLMAFSSLGLLGSYCSPGDFKVITDDTATSTSDDTGSQLSGFDGTIEGTVRVQLYTMDDDGEYVYKDWSVHGDDWPFGGLWVYAFTENESTGDENFYANQSILAPTQSGDGYELSIKTGQTDSIWIGAQLDWRGDGIMGTFDPVGVYPLPVSVTDGSTVTGVDITILAFWNPSGGGSGGGGGGWNGTGGGNGNGSTTISGDIIITYSYAGGNAASMLMDMSMQGPYYSDMTTPEPVGGGAEAAYSMIVNKDYGEMNLMGCHDSNYNQVIDAADQCGAYISDPDVDANPIDVCCDNNLEADIQVPLGDYELDLVPFVRLTGNITSEIGALGDYPKGSKIYVTALKYRPVEDLDVQDLIDNSYDVSEFETDDLGTDTSVPYSLIVPANTIVYLVSYLDVGANGVVQEADEPLAFANPNSSNYGRIPTGTKSKSYDMELAVVQ
jgi:hypothetical protein